MKNQSFNTSIQVPFRPEIVFAHINDVSKWWSKDFEGSSTKPDDEFIICHPGRHFSKQKLVEVIPGRKIVWLVTESVLDWLERDKNEWTNTKMVFELIPRGDTTVVNFTHEGLVPEKECYARCAQGWDMVIKDKLYNFILNLTDKLDYRVQLKVNTTTERAVNAISNVAGWWAQEVEGAAKEQGGQFTVHFGKTWGTFRVTELSSARIIWIVTDCYLDLLKDTKEWNGTRLIFQFSNKGDGTVIDIIHEGLTPDKECFNDCTKGWDFYFKESLVGYLEKEQGLPGAGIHAWLETDGSVYRGTIYTRDQLSAEISGDLLLLDVKQTRVEQVLSAYSARLFDGRMGTLRGDYYMLLNNEPGLLEHLQNFVSENQQ